jgi:predicted histone-like DNA-binding protein
MRVKLIQRSNPLDREQSPKYYAHMENEGVIDLYELSKQITKYSSLSTGDVLNVLENMVDAASLFLLMGRGVHLGRLGMLRIILKRDGVDIPEDFDCNLIHSVKLKFTPNVQMKKQLTDISYEMIK